MDIVFQFGEFTADESFLKDFFSTAGAGAITVWLYFNNIKRNRINEETKKTQFETDRLVYFTAIFDKILKLVSNQIEQIDIFIEELDKDPLYIPLPGMFPLHGIERLSNKIDHAEYYHAFANQNRNIPDAIRSFDIIYSRIDYFDVKIKKIYEHTQLAMQRDFDRKMGFKNSLYAATNKFDDMMISIVGKSDKKEVFKQLDHMAAIYLQRMEQDPADYKIPTEQFFNPGMDLIKPFIKKEPNFYSLYLKICEAKNEIEGVVHSNKKLSRDFKTHRDDLTEALKDLNEHVNVLGKYRNPVQPPSVRKGLLSWLRSIIYS